MEQSFKNSLITATGALVTTGVGSYILMKQFPNNNHGDDWKVVGALGAAGCVTSAYGSTLTLPTTPAWITLGWTAVKRYMKIF